MSVSIAPGCVECAGQPVTETEPPATIAAARNGAALERSGSIATSLPRTGPAGTIRLLTLESVQGAAGRVQLVDGRLPGGEVETVELPFREGQEASPVIEVAVSQEQENIAKIEENRAKLVEAEAEVPKAMAEAFRSGRLGILDYYKLQNVQADTNMRGAIASASIPGRK